MLNSAQLGDFVKQKNYRTVCPVFQEHTLPYIRAFRKKYNFSFSSELLQFGRFDIDDTPYYLFYGADANSQIQNMSEIIESRGCLILNSSTEISVVQKHLGYMCHVNFDPDQCDYIYETRDFVFPLGKSFSKRRNLISYMYRNFKINLYLLDHENIGDALQILSDWQNQKSGQTSSDEITACLFALKNLDFLGVRGYLLYLNDLPAAFSIVDAGYDDVFMVLFQKSNLRHSRIDEFLYYELCRKHCVKKFMNIGQDVGHAGLRKFKTSMRPSHIVRKKYLYLP